MRICIIQAFSQHSSERKEELEQTSKLSVKKGGNSMTQTQVAYWNYKENQRHNLASEAEDYRSHTADEGERALHNRETERETHRHYLATETETSRADRANETIKTEQLRETVRSNMANEGLTQQKITETVRSNKASEDINRTRNAETQRHNVASESNESTRNAETERHNKRVEQYTSRDNIWSNIISAIKGLPGEKIVSKLLGTAQSTPGLTQEQKDRLAAETEYWKARTEHEQASTENEKLRGGSRVSWSPEQAIKGYFKMVRQTFAPDVAEKIEQYLGGIYHGKR